MSSGDNMDAMEVTFISDGSVTDIGFRAEWHIVGKLIEFFVQRIDIIHEQDGWIIRK